MKNLMSRDEDLLPGLGVEIMELIGRVDELERIVEQLRGPPATGTDETMGFKRIGNET